MFEKAEHNICGASWPHCSVPVPVRAHWLSPASTSEGQRCTEQATPAEDNTQSNEGKVLFTLQWLITVSLHWSIELLLFCKIMVNLLTRRNSELLGLGAGVINVSHAEHVQCHKFMIGAILAARCWKSSRRLGKKQYAQKTFPYLFTHCFKGHRTRNFPFLERAQCKSQQVHAPAEMCSPSPPSLPSCNC